MQRARSGYLWTFLFLIAVTMPFTEAGLTVERPFILWDKKDIAVIRKKIETEAWAKTAYEKLINEPERHEKAFSNLFHHAIMGDNYEEPLSISDERESFTFADWAYLRISKDKVEVQGDLRTLRLPVRGKPKLLVNGEEKKTSFIRGYLYYCVPSK